jgi:hypothetical protein
MLDSNARHARPWTLVPQSLFGVWASSALQKGLEVVKRIVLVAAVVTALGFVGLPAARAEVCNNGAVKPGTGSSDWYECHSGAWRYYPPPTFDPNSGDGYGPNQPLPPLCIRFPDQYPCPQ